MYIAQTDGVENDDNRYDRQNENKPQTDFSTTDDNRRECVYGRFVFEIINLVDNVCAVGKRARAVAKVRYALVLRRVIRRYQTGRAERIAADFIER